MKRHLLLLLLTATPLFAITTVQETPREFSAAGDFNGDGFSDVLVLDKTSGIYRIGYGNVAGTLNFAEGRPSGMDTVTGFAVGKLSGTRDSFAVASPTANRAHVLSPLSAGYTEPKIAAAGTGAQLLAAFDMPGGPGPTAEDDLASFATLDPVMGTQLRALRSNSGTWSLLNQTDVPAGEVAHGNSLTPAAGATPLFSYMSRGGTTDGFHGWQLTGATTTEVLTVAAMPAGREYVSAIFEAPRTDVFFYTPGQPGVGVRRILVGAPWTFGAETAATFGEPIKQMVAVNDLAGTKMLVRFSSGALALYGYTEAGGFSAGQQITPNGANGLISGLIPMPGNAFQLLFAPVAGAASTTAVTFQRTSSGFSQTAITTLPALRPLTAFANVMLLADGPFRAPYVPLLRTYRARDWASGVTVGGGPFNVSVDAADYGGVSQGIGAPSGQSVGTAAVLPGGTAVNQQHARFSLFSFDSTLGSAVEDITISPAAGTYAGAVKIEFTGQSAGSTIYTRRNSSGPFTVWTSAAAPSIFLPTTVEFHVRNAAGITSPTRAAHYEFSKPPALQDTDGDGVPDFVEIARGLNPAGGPDSDLDGFSDRDEIAAGTDPNSAASKPAAPAPALDSMLVDISAVLQSTSGATTGTPVDGQPIMVHDPFGNAVGTASVDTSSSASLGGYAGFARLTAVGIQPELQYLVARTSEHFDVTPGTTITTRRGREMVALLPVTPRGPWSFGTTDTGLPVVQTPWSWGGVNWLAGSTNWNFGLGENEGFDANWSATQPAPEWGGTTAGYTVAAWQTQFQAAINRGAQPYATVKLTPVTTISALIAAKIIGDQLAARTGTAVDGTALAFDRSLAPAFEGLHLPDPAHPSAPVFQVQSLIQGIDLAVALDLTVPGAVALRKIARTVYARHQALASADLATLPMPLTALATFVRTGAMPAEYTGAGAGFTAADLAAASAKIAALGITLMTRPSATLALFTPNFTNSTGLTLVRNSSGNLYALLDENLRATELPADLAAGTPLFVTAYTDLPTSGGFPALEVIGIDLTSLPSLVGSDSDGDLLADEWELRHFGTLARDGHDSLDGSPYSLGQEYLDGTDPLSAGSSPLNPPTEMRFTEFQLAVESGTPRLRARWPTAYAGFVSVSFDTSPNLTSWTDNTAFNGTYVGSGYFTRDVTFTGSKGFFRAHARLKP